MKKVLVLCMIVAMAFMGCCKLTAPDGTETKSFANCFTVAQDKVCNATPAVLAVADVVIELLKPYATTLIPGSAPYVSLVTAQSIKNTGCAALTSLNTMIAFIQGYNTQAPVATKAGLLKTPPTIDAQALINWRDSVK